MSVATQDRQLAALEQTFPGWRITVVNRCWWAYRRGPVTPELRDAGVYPSLARPSAEALGTALSMQVEVIHRTPGCP